MRTRTAKGRICGFVAIVALGLALPGGSQANEWIPWNKPGSDHGVIHSSSGRLDPLPSIDPNGLTHWYLFVNHGATISWYEAEASAQQMEWPPGSGYQGFLATLTSQAENQFVSDFVLPPNPEPGMTGAWLGGKQNPFAPGYHEPDGGWEWVTGEPWDYTNWSPGQPDNWQGEDFLEFWAFPLGHPQRGQWNDICVSTPERTNYVVEFVPETSTLGGLLLGGMVLVRRRHAAS